MNIRRKGTMLALVLPLVLSSAGCSQVRAKMAFKDGNKDYKEEKYKPAIDHYTRAVNFDSTMCEAYFYLGSSHQALYRPGKDNPENNKRLEDAIAAYNQALACNQDPKTENQKTVKMNTLGSLTAIYSEDPKRNFDEAFKYADQLVQTAPNDSKNLYALANLYEKFGKIEKAEETYKRVVELNPSDTKACGALAAFYNKPNWDDSGAVWTEASGKERRSRFDQAISILSQCASLDPNDATGYQKVATFYWDKAYRDPLLTDEQKQAYADKGLEAVNKALQVKPDYFDAVIFKGLLLRVKANATADGREKQRLMDEAAEFQKMGVELRKQQQAEQAAAAAAAAAAPPAGGQ
jgi:tetratricopeptide (TPR) repeat protein